GNSGDRKTTASQIAAVERRRAEVGHMRMGR
ncbi:hypothetical protein A2U01_0096424, partial [Trifolium medium]|nr:hypothetical protein [Trifolium medium]